MANDPLAEDTRPAVVVFRSPLFNASETFVRDHVAALERYRPLLVGREDKGNVPPALRGSLFLRSRIEPLERLAARLRPHRPRLVHAHFATDGLAALGLARALGVPLVTTLHGYDVALSRARGKAVETGRATALREAALARGFPAGRTRTHYLGVDLERFRRGETREPGLILHVGRLVEKKGTAALIEATKVLTGCTLAVIGDGPERARLERQAAALGDRVRFLGALDPPAVAEWMGRAALLAAPSVTTRGGDTEGLPTVIVEAAASGLPVVATRHSGIPEAVADGETGFLVAEHDADALAERIARLLGSAEVRARMGAAGRRLAEDRFDLRRQTARLEAIYDEVAAGAS